MNICMITGEFPPKSGGQGFYALNLSLELISLGHQVTVLTRGLWRTKKETLQGITVYRVSCYPFYPIHLIFHGFFLKKQLSKVEQLGYDVLHLHSPLIPYIRTEKPVVVTEHGTAQGFINNLAGLDLFTLVSKICKKMFITYDKSVLKIADLISAVSASCREELDAYYGIKECLVIPNAVDTDFFRPAAGYHGTENDSNTVLFVGSFITKKGIYDLIEAARILTFRYNIKLNYVLVGDGPLRPIIKKRLKKYGLEGHFALPGYLDRQALLTTYQKSKMFVLPSYHEGLPTVILEAMACALPVVTTNVPGNKDLVSDGDTGLIAEPHQPEELAEAVKKLFYDKEMCTRLGEKGRRLVEDHYNWPCVTREYEKHYQMLSDAHSLSRAKGIKE